MNFLDQYYEKPNLEIKLDFKSLSKCNKTILIELCKKYNKNTKGVKSILIGRLLNEISEKDEIEYKKKRKRRIYKKIKKKIRKKNIFLDKKVFTFLKNHKKIIKLNKITLNNKIFFIDKKTNFIFNNEIMVIGKLEKDKFLRLKKKDILEIKLLNYKFEKYPYNLDV